MGETNLKRVLVVGGGPAGMMAAHAAGRNGNQVVLCEKNEKLGKKLYITGKGRCNVTNTAEGEEFLERVVGNRKFLNGIIRRFSPADTQNFLESHGVPLKIERGNRVFPVSDKSSDIIAAFQRALDEVGVKILLKTKVDEIIVDNSAVVGVSINGKREKFDVVIVATGGVSYPATGSDGWGMKAGEKLGLTTVPWASALCPVITGEIMEKPIRNLPFPQGLSLKNIALTLYRGEKILHEEFGELLFTDQGLSGPVVLSTSSYMNRVPLSECRLELDLKPALEEKQLDSRILRDFTKFSNKQLKNALSELLPSGMIPFVIKLSDIPPEKPVHLISKEERGMLRKLLKKMEFRALKLDGIENGIVSAGGISVNELQPKTMECKKIRGLKFAGETVDLDALTGGFNIQIALSTGFIAGDTI